MNNFWQDPNTGTWYIEKTAFISDVVTARSAYDHANRMHHKDKSIHNSPLVHSAAAFASPDMYLANEINKTDPNAHRSVLGRTMLGGAARVGGAALLGAAGFALGGRNMIKQFRKDPDMFVNGADVVRSDAVKAVGGLLGGVVAGNELGSELTQRSLRNQLRDASEKKYKTR